MLLLINELLGLVICRCVAETTDWRLIIKETRLVGTIEVLLLLEAAGVNAKTGKCLQLHHLLGVQRLSIRNLAKLRVCKAWTLALFERLLIGLVLEQLGL